MKAWICLPLIALALAGCAGKTAYRDSCATQLDAAWKELDLAKAGVTEGMVRLSSLNDDYYELDANNYRIIGRQSKRIISFGDEVMVEIVSANMAERTIDMELVETLKTH